MLQEIQVRAGVKKLPHPLGVCGFFLEKPNAIKLMNLTVGNKRMKNVHKAF